MRSSSAASFLGILLSAYLCLGGYVWSPNTLQEFANRNKTILVGTVVKLDRLPPYSREGKGGIWETEREAAFILVTEVIRHDEKKLSPGDTLRVEYSGPTQIVEPDTMTVDEEGRPLVKMGGRAFLISDSHSLEEGQESIFALHHDEGVWAPGFLFSLGLDLLSDIKGAVAANKEAGQ